MLHEKAVYILEGRTYFVEKYDHEQRRAHVREAEVDYYTDAITYTKVQILDRFEEEPRAARGAATARCTSPRRWSASRRSSSDTNENVGSGELHMPENEMHTTSYWLTLPRELHGRAALRPEERRDGVVALSYTLGQLAALFLMCDRHDLGVALGDNGQGEARLTRAARLGAARPRRAPARRRRLRAQHLHLRQLPGRHRPVRAALPPARPAARREPGAASPPAPAATAARPAWARWARSGSRGKEVALAILRAIGPAATAAPRSHGGTSHRDDWAPFTLGRCVRFLRCLLLCLCGSVAFACCSGAADVRAVVLGIAQDGGVPHIGCTQELCVRARRDPARRQRVACLGLVDDASGERFLIDATPDLPSQIESLTAGAPRGPRAGRWTGSCSPTPTSGTTPGLMYLGREALGARGVPVYATPRMARFLRDNGPWSQLVALGHIELREIVARPARWR